LLHLLTTVSDGYLVLVRNKRTPTEVDLPGSRQPGADFGFHVWRHTVATFLEKKNHSEWERGLVLNHSGSGVTAGCSHGHALDLKRALLCEWADHVQRLVEP
jgi:hypothetical protein